MIVYKILNKRTGKIYIGMTERTLKQRWKSHCGDAFSNKSQTYFHKSIRKHGPEAFIARVLFRGECKREIIEKEIYFITKYNSMNPKIGYNGTVGGTGGIPSLEVRAKISKKKKGKSMPWLCTEEVYAKISKANTGKKRSEVEKRRLSELHTGRFVSEETRKRMSISGKRRIFTSEHKQNISKSLKGRVQTDEWVKKRADSRRGYSPSSETREKISKATKGRIPWNKGRRKSSLKEPENMLSRKQMNQVWGTCL